MRAWRHVPKMMVLTGPTVFCCHHGLAACCPASSALRCVPAGSACALQCPALRPGQPAIFQRGLGLCLPPAAYQFNCTFTAWNPETGGANRSESER